MARTALRGTLIASIALTAILLTPHSGVGQDPPPAPVRHPQPAPANEGAYRRALRARSEMAVRPIRRPVGASDRVSVGTQFVVGPDGASSAWLEFKLPAAGRCEFAARWSGDLAACRLTVRDPAGNELHSPGASPLLLQLDATAAQVGASWRVTIEPGAGTGTARGELVATLPRPASPAPPPGVASEGCPTRRTLLDDGSVQLTYGDGTVVTYERDGGFTRRSPDGTESRAMAANIPPLDPPPPPDDARIGDWLVAISEQLLNQIRDVVGDDAAVDRYVSVEATAAPTVYQKISKRISVLGQLR